MFNRSLFNLFFPTFFLLILACETITPEKQFENFYEKFELEFEKRFPEGKYDDLESYAQLPDREALADGKFCAASLKKLTELEPDSFSPGNKEKWVKTFRKIESTLKLLKEYSDSTNSNTNNPDNK